MLVRDAKPTEELLKRELGKYSILHLATHGFFGTKGLEAVLEPVFAGEGQARYMIRESGRRTVRDHPGLLSGVILAGANVESAGGRDDGYLTAEEVSWLNLTGVRLVVLSACETGLGQIAMGEGLIGLRRAFRTAGADSVISSLWNVGDSSTGALMQAFYTKLLSTDGMGVHDALRSAQLEMLEENRDHDGDARPANWGPFIVDGDWR